MIEWQTIKPTLSDLVAELAGIAPAAVYWADESAGSAWVGEPSIGLRVSSVVGQGIEEEFRSSNGERNMTMTLGVQVRFTLSIIAQSFTQDIADPNWAGNVARRVLMGLGLRSSLERLAGICAVESDKGVRSFPYVQGDRQVSSYIIDLLMRTVDNHVDTYVSAGNFINEVVIDGQTVNDAAGPVVPQPHLDIVGDA